MFSFPYCLFRLTKQDISRCHFAQTSYGQINYTRLMLGVPQPYLLYDDITILLKHFYTPPLQYTIMWPLWGITAHIFKEKRYTLLLRLVFSSFSKNLVSQFRLHFGLKQRIIGWTNNNATWA